jgi:3-deoxy-D-manno-octulosonate 8-phosphate phosphatase KdsC-like HAD superfamily phosphatase
VARLARLRTERAGGQGAVREICDMFFALRAEDRSDR